VPDAAEGFVVAQIAVQEGESLTMAMPDGLTQVQRDKKLE
jgi:hypothetical protein